MSVAFAYRPLLQAADTHALPQQSASAPQPVGAQPMSALVGPASQREQLAWDMAPTKRPASPPAHAAAGMRARKPSTESAGTDGSERQGAQPAAHASAAAAHSPSAPPHGLPVGGARSDVAAGSVAAHPCTAAFLQKASHVPSAQPAGGGGDGGGGAPGASATQRKPTVPWRSYAGAMRSSLLCVLRLTLTVPACPKGTGAGGSHAGKYHMPCHTPRDVGE